MKITGILFDLDGVITETSEYHFIAWQALAKELGISIGCSFNEELKGVGRMESLERILAFGGKSDAYTQAEKEQLTQQKNQHYVSLLQDITPDNLLPGIYEFIQSLREEGIGVAVASASRNAPFILSSLRLDTMIDYVANAGKSRSKPYPDIFLDAARGIGRPPEECVGIEDAAAGVQAIHAAGMKAVGIGSPLYLGEAELVLEDTRQLTLDRLRQAFLS